jgi:hypothetical protein
MGTKTEAEIRADIRRLKHQLDRHRLTRIQGELVAARREIETLRAELRSRPSDATPTRPARARRTARRASLSPRRASGNWRYQTWITRTTFAPPHSAACTVGRTPSRLHGQTAPRRRRRPGTTGSASMRFAPLTRVQRCCSATHRSLAVANPRISAASTVAKTSCRRNAR